MQKVAKQNNVPTYRNQMGINESFSWVFGSKPPFVALQMENKEVQCV